MSHPKEEEDKKLGGHNQTLFDLDRDYQKYCQPKKIKQNVRKSNKLKINMNKQKSKLKKQSCNHNTVMHSVSSVRNATKRKATQEKNNK